MTLRRVAITGIGMISPIGNDVATAWKNVTNGVSGVGPITLFPTSEDLNSRIAGEVKNLNPEDYVSKKDVKRFDRFSLMALGASKEAWKDSGLEGHSYQPVRCGTLLGVGIGGLATMEDNHQAMLNDGPRRVSPFVIPAMIANLAPGNIAIEYNLQGVNYVITSACTSGTHAIGEAYRMISHGVQDVVLTGGAEAAITPLGVAGFARMRALSTRNDDPTKASRPFDRDRDGFVIGEGAAILVLEDMDSAKQRGAKIYAEVVGYGFSCDAYHITAPPEGGDGAKNCMRLALADSKLRPEQIGYINAHGTSTPINDPAESRAIKEVFGDYAQKGLMVSSTKSMTGHLLGAAGGVEGAFLAKVVHEGVVPPTINLDNPDEGCDLDYVPHSAREASIEAAMSNSFGFGGTNASIIFKRV